MQKRCRCGLPSIGGLATPLCCRHYHERQWGKDWAEKCATNTITVVRDRKTGDIIVYQGMFEDEAVRNAYVQEVLKDYNTWQYQRHNELVQRYGRKYWCGQYGKGNRHRFVLQERRNREEENSPSDASERGPGQGPGQ